MKRMTFGAVFVIGVLTGFVAAGWLPERVEAQSNWQCRSWTLAPDDSVAATGNWLTGAKTVELAAAGLSAGSKYSLVACRQ